MQQKNKKKSIMAADFSVPAFSTQSFFRCTQLIGNTENDAFRVCGRTGIQRKHVAENHIAFDFSQSEIPGSILKSKFGMKKTVETMALIGYMPVIEKVVVQQGAANQNTFV